MSCYTALVFTGPCDRVAIRTERILKHSDCSDPDSIGPSIPLTNLIFDYHLVVKALLNESEGDMGICGVAMLNKMSIGGVAVILNSLVCDVCVCHSAVFSEMKLFGVLWFLVWSFSDLNLAC